MVSERRERVLLRFVCFLTLLNVFRSGASAWARGCPFGTSWTSTYQLGEVRHASVHIGPIWGVLFARSSKFPDEFPTYDFAWEVLTKSSLGGQQCGASRIVMVPVD